MLKAEEVLSEFESLVRTYAVGECIEAYEARSRLAMKNPDTNYTDSAFSKAINSTIRFGLIDLRVDGETYYFVRMA
ncbi:MAG: hypothetical protein G01um101429_1118 [Parcubacteria group bacterium Gr01-1014_29]|nr:MAG: hypothetical protein G01um101429_1118 [Parcubacteria group bacterium Gr01-1014_29]